MVGDQLDGDVLADQGLGGVLGKRLAGHQGSGGPQAGGHQATHQDVGVSIDDAAADGERGHQGRA